MLFGEWLLPCMVKEQRDYLSTHTVIMNFLVISGKVCFYPPFSVNAVPFQWMGKDRDNHANKMALEYEIKYDIVEEDRIEKKT